MLENTQFQVQDFSISLKCHFVLHFVLRASVENRLAFISRCELYRENTSQCAKLARKRTEVGDVSGYKLNNNYQMFFRCMLKENPNKLHPAFKVFNSQPFFESLRIEYSVISILSV